EPSGVAGTQFGFGQFNINGSRDRSNNYTLDGIDNNDPFFNNSALNQTGITGAPGSLLPIDAIQEFNLQSQFGAEYGRNTGAVVNIITKSGTNNFHGSIFEYVRNNFFDARNYFNRSPNPQSPFKNNQFGASLGGPIIKNKTFIFGAYEGQRERVGSDFIALVPTATEIANAQTEAIGAGATINPALTKVLDLFPQPTSVNPTTGVGTVAESDADTNDINSFIVKVDHLVSDNEQLSGRYAYSGSKQVFPLGSIGGFGAGSRIGQFAQTSPTRVQVVSLSLVSSFSSTHINEVRVGYARYRTSFSSLDASFDPSSLGLTLGTGETGLPEFDFGGQFDNLGATAFSIPRGRVSETYHLLDNYTIVHGVHTLKFGGEFRRAKVNGFNDNLERGLFNFTPPSPTIIDPATDVLATFYEGNGFIEANAGNTQRVTYNNGLSFFAQDDYRVRPNLTLNLGLRWEYFGPISEKNNLLSNLAPDGTLAMVGTHGLDGAYNRDLHDFGPRLGLAWSVRHNTVVRAGYGIYYDYIPQDLLIANFTNSAGLVTNPAGPVPVASMNVNFSNYTGGGPIFSPATPPFTGASIFVTPRNLSTPSVQNWNVNIQQQLGGSASAEIGYVGSKGTHLVRLFDANQPDINGNRPNPNFGFVDTFAAISNSTYNALQATLRMQKFHGWSGFTTYTFSKSLDDASDGIDFNFSTAALPQDSNNLHAEHGPSTFDTRHRFTAALNYDIPGVGALPKRFGEGWVLNLIASVQSGRPIGIITSSDTSSFPNSSFNTQSNFHQRPNLIPGVNPILPNWTPTTGYLNPAAFQQPADGTFGDLGRDAIYGPGYWSLDFSMIKNTQITERLALQFRAEFFNIFNHPNFALPGNSITPGVNADGSINTSAGAQGLITSTPDVAQGNPGLGGGAPRVIQLGVRLKF
ncbi:MAG: TonB-dependent receptor, partial [Acidobacteria bacterium]|nr:TonB-dependent receptor [Acidobacteriota bacterium]